MNLTSIKELSSSDYLFFIQNLPSLSPPFFCEDQRYRKKRGEERKKRQKNSICQNQREEETEIPSGRRTKATTEGVIHGICFMILAFLPSLLLISQRTLTREREKVCSELGADLFSNCMSSSDSLDDCLGTIDAITSSVDVGEVGVALCVSLDVASAVEFESVESCSLSRLGDGGDDDVSRDLKVLTLDRDRSLAARSVLLTELSALAVDASDLSVLGDDAERCGEDLELDALLDCLDDLVLCSRHAGTVTTVEDGGLTAATTSDTSSVESAESTTDDDDLLSSCGLLALEIDALKEGNHVLDALSLVLALDVELAGTEGADADKDSIKVLAELLESDVLADTDAGLELSAHGDDALDVA